jgi:hypothetical protein
VTSAKAGTGHPLKHRRLRIFAQRKRRSRSDIPWPEVIPGANSWESGRTVQTRLQERDFRRP